MARHNILNVEDRTKYRCECCNTNFATPGSKTRHIRMAHDDCHHNLRIKLGLKPIGGAK